MLPIKITQEAEADLEDIWDYISRDSVSAADRTIKTLIDEAMQLAVHPGKGQDRTNYAAGLRGWPCGNYIIYYRVKHNEVQVLRVIHGARSQKKALGEIPE